MVTTTPLSDKGRSGDLQKSVNSLDSISERDPKCVPEYTSQTKIGNLDQTDLTPFTHHQNVTGLDVPVYHPILMQEIDA